MTRESKQPEGCLSSRPIAQTKLRLKEVFCTHTHLQTDTHHFYTDACRACAVQNLPHRQRVTFINTDG